MKIVHSHLRLSPSDLINHLGCQHLTELNREVELGQLEKPTWNNPAVAILHRKGLEHEEAYLEYLKGKGLSVADLSERHSMDATLEAMKKGMDVIYQAQLKKEQWGGIADFLVRVEGKSAFGDYQYQVQDTKLSAETKAGSVLQLCFYNEVVGDLQGVVSETMRIVKPSQSEKPFDFDDYRYDDFRSYYGQVKAQFEAVILAGPHETYPVPVAKCEICQWWKACNQQWHDDDHLSLVAGMRSSSRKTLESEDVFTLEAFAKRERPLAERPSSGSIETFEKLHGQAKVQLEGRIKDRLLYEMLDAEEKRGLNRLPAPSDGDVYFDIEGDHFYREGGLEYLFGVAYHETGNLNYSGFWCQDRKGEKEAFKKWLDFIRARRTAFPEMHIYHYGHYEASAIKRLASRHAYGEVDVDNLLRGHVFVDLHSIIKEALQASVESYSLKDMEQFTGYLREADLFAASGARRSFSTALELNNVDKLDQEIIPLIELYNKDDCLATEALHKWVEEVYQEAKASGAAVDRPGDEEEEASGQVKERDLNAQQLFEALTEGISPERSERSNEEQGKWLLAHLVAYFRREERSNAWEFHHLNDMELDDLFYERKAIAYLQFEKDVSEDKTILHQYRFPPQELSLSRGDALRAILGDKFGSIHSIDKDRVVIKKSTKTKDLHPDAAIENNYIPTTGLETALQGLASEVIGNGFRSNGPYKVAGELLLGSNPSLKSQQEGNLRQTGEPLIEAAIRLSNDLDDSYLAMQGPPGTGKSYTGAHMIIDLIQKGKKVGITAVSHSVIRGLIDKVLDLAAEQNLSIECMHKSSKKEERAGLTFQGDNGRAIKALEALKVVGGTAFLWAREEAIDCADYLFVDEAGQMSLAYVLAISRCAKNIVLLGDPLQLEQPQKGAHPEGADVSALEHILNGRQTMPDDRGLFLDTTWRLNPEICRFTSEVYYEGRLTSLAATQNQKLKSKSPFNGAGLFYVPVEHDGNRNRSKEEVARIEGIIKELLSADTTWTDRDGNSHELTEDHILVVAPYNAQVNALAEALEDIRVGTVDKFQGKEAPVVIYSMASSSPEEAPRGMSFLYDPNRLNVATSRAQCISILVASPKLMMPECHTIDQMRWANGLCRYRELAETITQK